MSAPPLLLALLLSSALTLAPQASALAAPASPSFEVQFRTIPVPQNTAPTLAQDKSGFIWVATSKGLTRYDGYRLRPIEQDGETTAQRNLGWVRALAPARDGRMWIGTEFRGLMAHDPVRDRVEPHVGAPVDAKTHAPIRALAEEASGATPAVWVATMGQGLYRYEPATRRTEAQPLRAADGTPETRVLALQVGRDGAVWAGHWRGLARRSGNAWHDVALPGLPNPGQGTPVLALTETRDGRIWFGTQDGRLGVIEPGDPRAPGQPARWVLTGLGMPVQALAEAGDTDGASRLWVGTKVGLLWVNTATGAIEARLRHDPRRATGLAGNDISGLLRDRTGAMWITGYGLGLQRHQHHPALAVRGADTDADSHASGPLAEADVRVVLALKNGEVLAPTQRGQVVRLDARPGGGLATLGVWPREAGRGIVESLAEAPDGTIWAAGGGRLEQRTAEGRLLRDWRMDGGRAQRLVLRADGSVWLGMQEGLYRLASADAPALERVHPAAGPLHGGIYALTTAPDGRLWVGGQAGLLRESAPGAGRLETVPQAPDATLASPVVMGLLFARDGTLWVDTPIGGLHRLRGFDAQGRARFERIGERLGTEGVFGGNLHEDGRGRIWSQLNVYDPKADRLDSFGAAEGADFGSFWFFASAELPGGALLFGGSRGLLRVDPQRYASGTATPPLVVSALRVDGQPHHPDSLGTGLVLPAGTRTFGVEFAGLDYADPGRLRYQYRLQGLDADWTAADAGARSPSFGPLKPGRYTLQVRAAAGADRIDGAPQLELAIELLPLWWQTVWAKLLGAALALAAIRAWVRWRTRVLRRREAALQALVDSRTAELREASLTDALTGLRNRRYLELRLPDDLSLVLRRHESSTRGHPPADGDLVVMLLDLDHFKRVNDVHGHAAGDAVLVELARRLRRVFRESDSLVRWGGEEILMLVRGTRREDAAELAARACAAVRDGPFDIGGGWSLEITASIGFAAFPLDPRRPRAWDWPATLALADSALYAAKARGRDGWVGALEAGGSTPLEAPRDLDGWLRAGRLSVRMSAAPAEAAVD